MVSGFNQFPSLIPRLSRRQGLATCGICLLTSPATAWPDLLINSRMRRWSTGSQWLLRHRHFPLWLRKRLPRNRRIVRIYNPIHFKLAPINFSINNVIARGAKCGLMFAVGTGGLSVDLLAGAFFCRWTNFAAENSPLWMRSNLAWGAIFPSLGGELYFSIRKGKRLVRAA